MTISDKEIAIKVDGLSKLYRKKQQTGRFQALVSTLLKIINLGNKRSVNADNEFWALKDVSFQIKKGKCLGVVGLNGAGKSTLLKIILGRIGHDSGFVDIRGDAGGLLELNAGFNDELTGLENIYAKGNSLGFSRKMVEKKLNQIIEFSEIDEFINSPVKTYSSGMRMRLGFSVAINFVKDIIVCDEILAVGDFEFRQKCYNKISQFRNEKTFILVSHSSVDVSTLCDSILVLHKGHALYCGEVKEGLKLYHKVSRSMDQESAKELVQNSTLPESDHGEPTARLATQKIIRRDSIDKKLEEKLFYSEKLDSEYVSNVEIKWSLEDFFGNFYWEIEKPFVIQINFHLHKKLKKGRIGIPFFSENGEMLFGPDTRDSVPSKYFESIGEKEIEFTISSMPLLEGKFWVAVSIGDDPAIVYREHLGFFGTGNTEGLFGKFRGQYDWKVIK